MGPARIAAPLPHREGASRPSVQGSEQEALAAARVAGRPYQNVAADQVPEPGRRTAPDRAARIAENQEQLPRDWCHRVLTERKRIVGLVGRPAGADPLRHIAAACPGGSPSTTKRRRRPRLADETAGQTVREGERHGRVTG